MLGLMSVYAIARDREVNLAFPDGARYIGQAKDGKAHGRGMYVYPDGSKYEGQFRDGVMHGEGLYSWANGARYEGQFRDGNKHGVGTFTWPSGSKYAGQWRSDKAHGWGTMTWHDGRKYVGQWQEDKMHGRGTKTWPDGRRFEGQWRHGVPVEEEKKEEPRSFILYSALGLGFGCNKSNGTGVFNIGIGANYVFKDDLAIIAELNYKYLKGIISGRNQFPPRFIIFSVFLLCPLFNKFSLQCPRVCPHTSDRPVMQIYSLCMLGLPAGQTGSRPRYTRKPRTQAGKNTQVRRNYIRRVFLYLL